MLKDYWFQQDRNRMQGAATALSRNSPRPATSTCSASSSARSLPISTEHDGYHPLSNQLLSDGSECSPPAGAAPACASSGQEEGLPGAGGITRPGGATVTAAEGGVAESVDSWDSNVPAVQCRVQVAIKAAQGSDSTAHIALSVVSPPAPGFKTTSHG